MAVRIGVFLALLFAFAYGFAKLVERYGGVGEQPSPRGGVFSFRKVGSRNGAGPVLRSDTLQALT